MPPQVMGGAQPGQQFAVDVGWGADDCVVGESVRAHRRADEPRRRVRRPSEKVTVRNGSGRSALRRTGVSDAQA